MKIHKCDVCGSEKEWSKNHSWWGSMLTDEFGHRVTTCSDNCRKEKPEKIFRKKYGRSACDKYYK